MAVAATGSGIRGLTSPSRVPVAVWFLFLAGSGIAILSHVPETNPLLGMLPVIWVTIVGGAAGIIYLRFFFFMAGGSVPSCPIWIMIGAGLILRLVMFGSAPLWEIDFFRYLWDGGVLAHGLNPYSWSPDDIRGGLAPAAFAHLTLYDGQVLDQINYPYLRTIYPPVAQAFFALAHVVDPWGLTGWRTVLLLCDGISLYLLLLLLRQLNLPAHLVALYWWNPLVIQMIFNAAHMDAVLLPFLLAAVLFAVKHKPLRSAGALSLAVGVKLWPMLLILPLMCHATPYFRQRLAGICLFGVLGTLILAPMLLSGLGSDSGLTAFAQTWSRNNALFGIVEGGTALLFETLGAYTVNASMVARAVVTGVVSGVVLWSLRSGIENPHTLGYRLLLIIAVLLLCSPASYPWYYVWAAPLLVIAPVFAIALWTMTLPLYHLKFHPWFLENPDVFNDFIVWIEHGPVIMLLLVAIIPVLPGVKVGVHV